MTTGHSHRARRILAETSKVIANFSCGAASAVATKLALKKYPDLTIIYCDTGSEHPDNVRFLRDCERWFGRSVIVLRSEKYKDTWDVFESARFLSSPEGAKCTTELKKLPAQQIWNMGDIDVLGYTAEEGLRVKRFLKNNPERIVECPLIERQLTKSDSLAMVEKAGIELPAMYRLGFRNNNCIACVKARDNLDYWKRIRKHFPAEFERMAKLERELNFCLNRITRNGDRRNVWLDELPDGDPTGPDPQISCGLFCGAEEIEAMPK